MEGTERTQEEIDHENLIVIGNQQAQEILFSMAQGTEQQAKNQLVIIEAMSTSLLSAIAFNYVMNKNNNKFSSAFLYSIVGDMRETIYEKALEMYRGIEDGSTSYKHFESETERVGLLQ